MQVFRDLSALLLVTVVVLSSAASNATAAEAVFSDRFDNLGNWVTVQGKDPKLGLLQAGETTSSPCMILGNAVVRADLPRALDKSFELSFRAAHSDYRRSLWVGLFNDDGTKGYVVMWDAGAEEGFFGQGAIAISEFDLAKEVSRADHLGTELTKRVPSGRRAVGVWPALFALTWDKASGVLTLKVEGVEKGRVIDRTLGGFSRVYVRGNEASVFADMRISEKPGATTRPSGATAR